MSQLDELVERTPASFRLLAWLIMALICALGAWAYLAKFEEVAVAQGEVVPQGQVKVIQHLEGGIIEEIYVVDGDKVAAGTPLVQLNLTALGANREELAVRLDSSLLARARLVAEASGKKPVFSKDVAKRRPNLADGERNSYGARQAEFASGLQVLRSQARQRELAITVMKHRKDAVRKDLELAREVFAMSSVLVKDGLTPKIDHPRAAERRAHQVPPHRP